MSIGSLAGMNIGVTLKLRARVPMPAQFDNKEQSSSEDEEEDIDTTMESAQDAQQ